MAEKKITELPIIEIPSASALIPIVVDGNSVANTNAISASALASYIANEIDAARTSITNTFAGTQNFNGAVFLNGDINLVGNITAVPITSLNLFTSSIRGEVSELEAYTQSLKSTGLISGAAQITALGFASSAGADTSQLNIFSGSVNTFTSSIRGEVSGIEAYTASLNLKTGSYATTSSNTYFGVQGISSSLFIHGTTLTTESGDFVVKAESGVDVKIIPNGDKSFLFGTDGILTFPLGGDIKVEGGNTLILYSVDSLNTYSGSIQTEVGNIEAYTSSLKAVTIVSSSTQIQNYNLFAETSSANTFYGTQTIVNPSVSNTELDGAYVTIRTAANTTGLPIGYRLINNNSTEQSILTMDPSNGTTSLIALTGTLKLGSNTGKVEMTGSVDVTGGITGSLMATNNVVSSSTQISNYYKFAETASANTFYGNQTISGSLFISGATEFGGNLVPKSAMGATLGTEERPFSDIFVSSGSINIASDVPGAPNTSLSNEGGNILVSAGGMRLVEAGNSFIAETGSFSFISGSMTQIGDYTQLGNHTLNGHQTITGSLDVMGNINVASGSGFFYEGNKLFNRGQFYHTATLSGSANTAYPFQYNTTDTTVTNGTVYVENNSKVYVKHTGIYNIQFSSQLRAVTNNPIDFSVWFSMTGSNVMNSNTDYTIEKVTGGGNMVAALNYLMPLSSGSYFEIYYSKTRTDGLIEAKGVQSTPTRPTTPSVILTVTQIA